MRWVCALTLLLTLVVQAGCAAEEDWTIRPPGGGMSGVGDPPDAGGGDDGDGGATGLLLGSVCVILDFENPTSCPNIGLATDVLVEVDTTTTRSTSGGEFEIEVATVPATVTIASELADSLVTTLSQITEVGAERVEVPVVDEALWLDTQNLLLIDAAFGTAVIYVRDTSGNPVAGATVAYTGTPTLPGAFYFDDGSGGWVSDVTTTGPDGIALIIDTSSESYTATLDDRTRSAVVMTAAEGIGVAVITLPD
jgi:hypothetical protein